MLLFQPGTGVIEVFEGFGGGLFFPECLVAVAIHPFPAGRVVFGFQGCAALGQAGLFVSQVLELSVVVLQRGHGGTDGLVQFTVRAVQCLHAGVHAREHQCGQCAALNVIR